MTGRAGFQKLLEPLQIGNVILRNRMVKPGQTMKYAEKDGYASQRIIDFYEALSRGGVGMLIVENSCVNDVGNQGSLALRIDEDKYIPAMSELAQAIHKHGCPTFLQFGHSGPAHRKEFSGLQPVAASSLKRDELPIPSLELPRELTVLEIEETVDNYVKAALRAQKAGFDGVEIHAAHQYLLNSFLSRIWNKRHDDYGCDTSENRARFPVAIIKAIKSYVGRDFPVGIRINGMEFGLEAGTTSEESQAFGQLLEAAGADYIHITGFGYGLGPYAQVKYPEQLLFPEPTVPLAKKVKRPGALVPMAAAIKMKVSIPVVAVGRLDPSLGEWILQHGKADLIALGRRLLADPELPNKVIEGRLEDIRPCMACLECLERLERGEPAQCRVNASLGREREYEIKPAGKKKKVVVVGGGPAGMEAARVAAERGHEVTLYEREPKIGGLLPLAAFIKGLQIEDLTGLIAYQKTRMAKYGVTVEVGREVDLALIEAVKPDVAIVAAGGIPTTPDIPGIDSRSVVSTADLRRRSRFLLRFLGPGILGWLTKLWLPMGKRVVVIGGQIHGCEIAEFLVKRGRQVTIIESAEQLGGGIPGAVRTRLLAWLAEKGVTVLTGATIEKITGKGLNITTRAGEKQTIEADAILSALPLRADTGLCEVLQKKVPEVYAIGDCHEPHLILEATADGARIGHAI